MFKLSSLSITRRLGLLIFSALAGITLMALVFLYSERQLVMAERENGVRQTVEVAHDLIAHFHAQIGPGKMSEEEAKQRALQAIKALRYSGSEYFWINDLGKPVPKMIMHATVPALDGKVLDEARFNKAIAARDGKASCNPPTTILPRIKSATCSRTVAKSGA